MKFFFYAFFLASIFSCANKAPLESSDSRGLASDPAGQFWLTTIKIGPSVPAADPKFNFTATSSELMPGKGGPSRRPGGEVFAFTFVDPKMKTVPNTIIAIRLVAYSKSGKGKVLVHQAEMSPAQPKGTFASMTNYASILSGTKAENYNGAVLLGPGDFVGVSSPNGLKMNTVQLTLEGFGNDDASVVVQLQYAQSAAGEKLLSDRRVLDPAPVVYAGGSGGGGTSSGSGGGSYDYGPISNNNNNSDDGSTGAIHHGGCVSHSTSGGCENWSNGDNCVSHNTGGGCETWSNGASTTNCISHNTGGGCETWSSGASTTNCISHNTSGGCETWSSGASTTNCISHNTSGGCETWSSGSTTTTCISHNTDGSCNMWN